MQVIQLPPDSGDLSPEHDHLHDGQEEVYLLLDGSGELDVAGERISLGDGTFVRVGSGERRRLRSGPHGARVLAIGACPGRGYEPQPNSELGGPEVLAPTARSSMSSDETPTTDNRRETAMAIGIYFAVQGMTAEKFAKVHERLAAIGQANPPGRTFHAGFHVGDGIHVFDVWESHETFEAFGQHLMPILAENGIDPGEPRVGEIELLMTPA